MAVIEYINKNTDGLYSDGDQVEQDILSYVQQYRPEEYWKVLEHDQRWPVFYHLTDMRENILNWYEFSPGCDVLEIGGGMGALTDLLCRKAGTVTTVELTGRRAETIFARCKEFDNLKILVGNFNEIQFENHFDYITLIGVLKYAPGFTPGGNPADFLKKVRKLLKPGGKLLLAIENRFGLKYWCGAKEDHTGKPFDGINGYPESDSVRTFSRHELANLLESVGLGHQRFYYPLPDYKLPQVLYSDAHLPKGELSKRLFFYYPDDSVLFADEMSVYNEIIQNGAFPTFANSFFVECCEQDAQMSKVAFASFTQERFPEYRIITVISTDHTVRKIPALPQGKKHIQTVFQNQRYYTGNDLSPYHLTGDCLEMPYLAAPDLESILCDCIQNRDMEAVKKWLTLFREHVERSAPHRESGTGTILCHGFLDMTFRNCFVVDDDLVFFDQEWMEEDVPVERILYRAVLVLYSYHPELVELLPREDLHEMLRLEEQDVNQFMRQEDIFIRRVCSHNPVDIMRKNFQPSSMDASRLFQASSDARDVDRLAARNAQLETQNRALQESFDTISNAFFWKITKPARYTLDILKRLLRLRETKALVRKGLLSLRTDGVRVTWQELKMEIRFGSKYRHLAKQALFSEEELAAQRAHLFPRKIKFSIVVPLYNTPEQFQRAMIESVLAQTYGDWELCMADGSDAAHRDVERVCREYAEKDNRIRYRKLEKDLGISGNTNACLEMAKGDYIGLLEHDDLLHPAALYEVMRAICEKNADFVYTDESAFHDTPEDAYLPNFKSAFAPDSLRGINYISHFTVFKRALLEEVGLFDPACDGAQDYDMALRLTEKAERIAHIPEILYYCRTHARSALRNDRIWPTATKAGIRALEKQLKRLGLEGRVEPIEPGQMIYRICYAIKGRPKISILIPNYEHKKDLKTCLDTVFNKSTWPNYEIVIVENNSRSQEIFDYYDELRREHENVRVVTWQEPFNYSAVNNYGAQYCTGDYLLLLNNDTEVITPNWIQEMLMFAQRPDVGAVGAKLYYSDDTVQHGGVIFGMGGLADHMHKDYKRTDHGYMERLLYAQNLTAVTAACMMLRRDVWEKVGGLDEDWAVAFNDVDLCMRIRQAGYLIVWTPFAELYHYESKSRGVEDTPEKQARFRSEVLRCQWRWKKELDEGDPYYNPNLTLDILDFSAVPVLRQHDAR